MGILSIFEKKTKVTFPDRSAAYASKKVKRRTIGMDKYRRDYIDLYRMYKGNQGDVTTEMLRRYYKNKGVEGKSLVDTVPVSFINIVSFIISERAQSFDLLSIRFAKESDQKQWKRILSWLPDTFFDDLNTMTELFKKVVVTLIPNSNNEFGHDIEIVKPYELGDIELSGRDLISAKRIEYDEEYKKVGEYDLNIKKTISVEIERPERGHFFAPVREDLITSQHSVNHTKFNLAVHIKHQAHAQAVGSGVIKNGQDLSVGDNILVEIDPNVEKGFFHYAQPVSNITELQSAIDKEILDIMKKYLLDADKSGANPESALALMVRNKRLTSYLIKKAYVYQQFVYRFIELLNEMLREQSFPEFSEMPGIEIVKPETERTTDEQIKFWTFLLSNNVKSSVQIASELYGVDEKSAEEIVKKIIDWKKANPGPLADQFSDFLLK